MAENSKIQWTDSTFNPWRGCTKVSEGCAHCYAQVMSGRNPDVLGIWGPEGTRIVASESQWREPLKWNKAATAKGERHRVFCASLADVFEGPETMPAQAVRPINLARARLFNLIALTPHLDWLLLTKRPQNWRSVLGDAWNVSPSTLTSGAGIDLISNWLDGKPPANVWFGTSVENQAAADTRIPHLLATPAVVRFLSCEPLLGPVNLDASLWKECAAGIDWQTGEESEEHYEARGELHWVIVGGESGARSRPMQLEWARSLVRQCQAAKVACFVKQLGAAASDEGNGIAGHSLKVAEEAAPLISLRLKEKKGGDITEWPADLRVRQFPGGSS